MRAGISGTVDLRSAADIVNNVSLAVLQTALQVPFPRRW